MIRKSGEMDVEVRENMRGGSGRITIRHYFKKDEMTADSRLCAILTIPPGGSIGLHEHDKEDEVYIVLSGSGVIDDGGEKREVVSGDAVLTGNGESHALINTGTDDLEIIAVIMQYDQARA